MQTLLNAMWRMLLLQLIESAGIETPDSVPCRAHLRSRASRRLSLTMAGSLSAATRES